MGSKAVIIVVVAAVMVVVTRVPGLSKHSYNNCNLNGTFFRQRLPLLNHGVWDFPGHNDTFRFLAGLDRGHYSAGEC